MSLDPDIENLAVELRDLFAHYKQEQTGRNYRPMERHRRIELWRAAAELCAGLKAHPDSFVQAAFRFNTVPGGPFPQTMATRAAVRWYKEFSSVCEDGVDPFEQRIRNSLRHGLGTIINLVENGENVTRMLLNPYMIRPDQMPAYERVLLWRRPEILAAYGQEAYAEISSNPRLTEVLEKLGYDLSFLEVYKQ